MMFDQMLEGFRGAWVSSLEMQQEVLRQYAQQWPTIPLDTAGFSVDWAQRFQKRWSEFLRESLIRQREIIDSTYKGILQVIEQMSHLSEAKTPEDYRRAVDETRHKMFETFKNQSDAQLRDFQLSAEKWFEVIPSA